MSFDERSNKIAPVALESSEWCQALGRLGREKGSSFVDQLMTASVVGGRDGGLFARKGIFAESTLADSLVYDRGSHLEEGGYLASNSNCGIARRL